MCENGKNLKIIENHGLCGIKIKRKSGDVDAFAAQHGTKPHGQHLQRHSDARHGLRELTVVELDLVDQVERFGEAQDSAARKKEEGRRGL
jgi:hypothetical protein